MSLDTLNTTLPPWEALRMVTERASAVADDAARAREASGAIDLDPWQPDCERDEPFGTASTAGYADELGLIGLATVLCR